MTLFEITKNWQPFYGAVAGISATLMGLLFVSIALHSSHIHEEENSHFLRLARLTFSNYLMLLVLALQMLVPIGSKIQMLIPILVVSIIGLFWTIMLRNKDLDKADPSTPFLKRSYRLSLVSYLMLLALVALIFLQPEIALYLLLSPILMLIISSVRNSWGLLMMLRLKS
ncbi:MAG: hypothetical protein WCG75_06325 [Armatimonadota bacterium]